MIETGQLIACPACLNKGKQQYLGRILPNGDLIVLRFHHGTTLIKASNYYLVCGCGFKFDVSGTVIQAHYAI